MAAENPDWYEWHEGYRAGSDHYLVRRLAVVQGFLREALAERPEGAIRVGSLCAGQGDDLLGVLADHARSSDVRALLVDADERNVAAGAARAASMGLIDVRFVAGDAGTTAALAGIVPLDVLLVCGMFGNITMSDVERTIGAMPELLTAGATVIWTRRSVPNDTTPRIRSLFAEQGFAEVGFVNPETHTFTVGCQRFDGTPRAFVDGRRLFDFVGYRTLIDRGE